MSPGSPFREIFTARLAEKACFGRKIRGGSLGSRGNYGQIGLIKQVLDVKIVGARRIREIFTAKMSKKASFGRKIRGGSLGCPPAHPFERNLRPDWQKKHVLAVKSGGSRRVRENFTARLAEKACFGRKIRGKSLGSRDIYGQIG